MGRKGSIVTDAVELWIISESAATLSGLDRSSSVVLGGMPQFVGLPTWPGCERCGRAMSFVAQVGLRWLPLKKPKQWGDTTIFVFYCFECSCGTAFGRTSNEFAYGPALEGATQALRQRKLPPPLPRFDVAVLYDGMRGTVDRHIMRGCIGYLGIDPQWNYDDESPYCSGCGKRTSFLLRVTSLRLKNGRWVWKFGGGGGIWVTCCENCNGGQGRAAIDSRFFVVTQGRREDDYGTETGIRMSRPTDVNPVEPPPESAKQVRMPLTTAPELDPAEARTSISLRPLAPDAPMPDMADIESSHFPPPVEGEVLEPQEQAPDDKGRTRFKLKKPGQYLNAPSRRKPKN